MNGNNAWLRVCAHRFPAGNREFDAATVDSWSQAFGGKWLRTSWSQTIGGKCRTGHDVKWVLEPEEWRCLAHQRLPTPSQLNLLICCRHDVRLDLEWALEKLPPFFRTIRWLLACCMCFHSLFRLI